VRHILGICSWLLWNMYEAHYLVLGWSSSLMLWYLILAYIVVHDIWHAWDISWVKWYMVEAHLIVHGLWHIFWFEEHLRYWEHGLRYTLVYGGISWYMVDACYGTCFGTWFMHVMVYVLVHGWCMIWYMFWYMVDGCHGTHIFSTWLVIFVYDLCEWIWF